VVRHLDDAGVEVGELSLRGSSLDEVFLSLTGHRARDESGSESGSASGSGHADQGELRAVSERSAR